MKKKTNTKKKPVPKTVKRKSPVKTKKIKEKLVGRVAHYYDKIKVAAITLQDTLSQGDTIRIEGGGHSFTQKVESMQIDHEKVTKAKKKDDVGFKVKQKVHEGYRVFKLPRPPA